MKFIILDDEMSILKLLENYFNFLGQDSLGFLYEESFFDEFNNSNYDAVFIDYNISGSSSYEIITKINDCKIIIISGEDREYISVLKQRSDLYYLKKPFTIYDLRNLLISIFPDESIKEF